jgi:glucoamylase
MSEGTQMAPGWPGIPPRWTSSAKSGVGTSLGANSRVWFTISHGILNEVYYPRVDQACTRDLGLIVTDGRDFFSEEKRDAISQITAPTDGVPAYRLVNTCARGHYRIEKEIVSDPTRDVVLQKTLFVPLQPDFGTYHLYALLASHLGNYGSGNTAWIGDYKGVPMLFAERAGFALALACSVPWSRMSVGFVGISDGWQDLHLHGQMTWLYQRAENGNVGLMGEIDLEASGGAFVLALGFGRSASEAGHRARASLLDGFDAAKGRFRREWENWQKSVLPLDSVDPGSRDLYRVSAAVLRTHEAPNFPGGMIASLSVPWGFAKGDDDLGGYHLAWPRDLVEAAEGLLAAGVREEPLRVLEYLQVTQEADGHWAQNMWIDGTPYWQGVQMDETALPILLIEMLRREGALSDDNLKRFWQMVRRAVAFIACNGPVTQQDRWEEDPGFSPFTLAAEIAALLVGADLAEMMGEHVTARYLLETADAWNAQIERWMYVTGTELAHRVGVEGYYVRVAPADEADAASPMQGFVPIKNRPPGESSEPAASIVSPDALALVRFGLRAANDPRITNTVKVIDALLRTETPRGPVWHRYPGDGYGEHEDGSPFDGTGIGRAWPLLTGERAHYELAAGRVDEANRLLRALESFANEGGLLPEQIWDSRDIPSRELVFGRPSGSAMPLVWAHAEYIKLRRSLRDGKVFDTPAQTAKRYLRDRVGSPRVIWRFNNKCRRMAAGKTLRVEIRVPFTVRWSTDDWHTPNEIEAQATGLGIHVADLPTGKLHSGAVIVFTLYWPAANRWEGTNFTVLVA